MILMNFVKSVHIAHSFIRCKKHWCNL